MVGIVPIDEAQSTITTSSYRVAEGGMEYVNIYSVNSSARLLEALSGKMIKIGTDLNATKKVSDLPAIAKGEKPILIILGNEEHGISDIIRKNCDELVIIPWAGMNEGVAESVIDSLNVAQASSIIFYEMMKK